MNQMNRKIKDFTDILVWQEGHKLVIEVYRLTKEFPKEEAYSLTNQMRRAATSVTANISEGYGRHSYKERLQYYYLSQGSLTELKNHILIARDVGYLNKGYFDELMFQANITHQLLQGFIRKTKEFIKHKS